MAKHQKVSAGSNQESSLNKSSQQGGVDVGLYVHLPFCVKKCRYCDFNSYAYTDQNVQQYLNAVIVEAKARAANLRPSTVFIGGGTPTLVPPDLLHNFISNLSDITSFSRSAAEITIEANPESLNLDSAQAAYSAGVNRISIGFQSLHNDVLKQYDRVHSVNDSIRAFNDARECGFRNINIDLIYSFPGQEPEQWCEDLQRVHQLAPEHLSCYELSYEQGTSLTKLRDIGRHRANDDEFNARMFGLTRNTNAQAGYSAYEISAFAKDGFQCRHNLAYWNSLPYIGLGAGAASWQNPVRSQNLLSPEEYCEAILNCSPAFTEQQTCTPQTTLFDCLMMALRLEQKGANSNLVKEISGLDPIVHYEKIWQQLIGQGLIEFVGDDGEKYIRPTKAGILQLDTILCQLLPDDNQLTV